MRKASRKALSLVLSFLMTLSVGVFDFSLVTYAEEPAKANHVWTAIDLEDISDDDYIAITMTTQAGTTYVLPNAKASSSGPVVVTATVKDGEMTIAEGSDSDYAWKITKTVIEKVTSTNDENEAEPNTEEPENGSLDELKKDNLDNPSTGASGTDDDNKQPGDNSQGDDKQSVGDVGENNKGENPPILQSDDGKGKESNLDDNKPANNAENKKETVDPDAEKNNDVKTPANGNVQTIQQTVQEDPATTNTDIEPEEEDEDGKTITEEYYTIESVNGGVLYTNAANNNGVRVGSAPNDNVGAKWKVDSGYLCAQDSKEEVRYLGVYNAQDFRAYLKGKDGAISNNIKGQKLVFYKLTDQEASAALQAPKASIESGEEVDYDTEITLTCDTKDAKIYYNTNDTENFSEYKEPIKIKKDCTIHAYALIGDAGSGEKSEQVSFEYTLKKGVKIKDLSSLIDGQEFVLVHDDKEMMSSVPGAEKNNKKLSSISVELNEEGYLVYKDTELKIATLKLEKTDNEGEYYIAAELVNEDSEETSTGYLTTGATGNALTLEKEKSSEGLDLWEFEESENGSFLVKSVKAKYHDKKTNVDKLQYFEYYNNFFTVYSYTDGSNKADYTFSAYTAPECDGEETPEDELESDPNTELLVAQWSGNADYSEKEDTDKYIYGDMYKTGDMQDTDSKYQVFVDGNTSMPYTSAKSTSTGSTNYYMGSKGVVKNTDYIQMEFPTLGYADMNISFRMRSSKTAVGAYQLQYSSTGKDGSFKNLSEGSYSYKTTIYRDNKPSEKKGDGKISDGIAKTSLAPEEYISFDFKIPEGANNKEKVYVRLVPATSTNASGKEEAGSGGANRIDTVRVFGHPVVSDKICGHVIADPASGEITSDTKIALSSKTEDAEIYYSVDGGEYEKYDADKKVTLTNFPTIVRAYATKEGLEKSVTGVYQYTQAQVATVKASPNGGAISPTQKITLSTKTEGAKILYRYKTKAELEKEEKDSDKDESKAEEQSAENGGGDSDELSAASQNEDEAAGIEENLTEQEDNYKDWEEYTAPFEAKELPTQIQVKAVKDGYVDSVITTLKFSKRKNERENIYFGQIHAHTNISDGAGSLEDAYDHAKNVDNLDYIIITDHSNSIDNEKESKITENVDKSLSDEWTYAHNLAKQKTTEDFTCAYGYEMTWSNGLGHMNTFNTEGFQSRTQTEFSTYSTALQNYYAALRTAPDSISQFNHPGTTFGDFQDFSYYSEDNDALITMIEVGNGEGAIGSSGYFPSYEYYVRALDKGWHVAPTNNQDNHKGLWGDANTARTVMLADENTEEAIYDAMRNYRIYATEDNDLSIYYTLDGNVMGTILDKDAVGDTVEIKADIKEPTDKAIGKVELIVNGGQSIGAVNVDKNEATVKFTAPSAYSYYFLRITEDDKDIAVTAPVWVGEVEACGINNTYTDTVLPVAGEDLDINVEFYNNEKAPLTINDIKIELSDVDGNKTEVPTLSPADAGVVEVASEGTATYKTSFVYDQAGQVTYEVTVNATLNGIEKIYKDKLTVNYALPKMVADVLIDGTHGNDYVSGYYGGNVNAFISLCANHNIRAKVVKDEITSDMLKNCTLLVLSAPAKKNDTAGAGPYSVSHYSNEFIAMVKDYVAEGGSVIVCGLADYSDSMDCQTATEQNKLLEAIGATIRMGSDEVCDDTNNGGQVYRMYPTNVNLDSPLLAGFREGQKYSQYSGCSVDILSAKANNFVDAAEWLVNGFDTTYSVNCKDDTGNAVGSALPNGVKGIKNDNDGKVTFLARQKTKAGGQIIVSGGVFLSDFEVKAEIDNNDSLPFANYTIVNNILDGAEVELDTTTIAEARKGKMNEVFAVEGYVTSGTDNPDTTFFDTIYIQDETGGMDIFPYATPGLKIGTKMRIVGFLAQYQGDLELKVISARVLNEGPKVLAPKVVDTKTAMDYDKLGGQLLQTTGKVTKVDYNSDGTVAEFWLKDTTGKEAAIFIDGYIKSGTTGKNTLSDFVKKGANVTAAGVLYKHPEGKSDVSVPVFRVRNCDDIYPAGSAPSVNDNGNAGQGSSDEGATGSDTQVSEGDNGGSSQGQDVQVQAGGDDTIGEQVTTPEKPKPHIPVVPVAVGFGIISVAAVTVVVVKVSVGASVAASAASGGKLASLLAKILHIFGK